jgi:hypothetical protein
MRAINLVFIRGMLKFGTLESGGDGYCMGLSALMQK